MSHERITVLLPCHSLEDFPVWCRGNEAEDLLAAWTAAWHPLLVATVGRMPTWRGIDRPADGLASSVAIVPAAFDHRFDVSSHEAVAHDQAQIVTSAVRHLSRVEEIAAEAAVVLGVRDRIEAVSESIVEDFYAVGLAWLLAELLSRRMRSQSMPDREEFAEELIAAARSAMEGDRDTAESHLDACHRHLETARAHYYPVDVWLLDLLLVASSTLDERLVEELEAAAQSGLPTGLVASGELIEQLGVTRPDVAATLREVVAAGHVEPLGGLWDDGPLAGHAPEEVLESFLRGRDAWRRHVGSPPLVFARRGGGSSGLVPQLLAALDYEGAIFNLFDGSPLPDPGTARIRWTGSGNAGVEALAKPPLDARDAAMILGLPEKLGQGMDHEHAAVLVFARYPGTASPWYERLRRIATRGSVLGRFALPRTLLSETASASVVVDYGLDAFRPPLPGDAATKAGESTSAADAIAAPRQAARREAVSLLSAWHRLQELLPAEPAAPASTGERAAEASSARGGESRGRANGAAGGWLARLGRALPGIGGRSQASDELLENGIVRVRVHPETGGLLSFRRCDDTANRLSQRLTRRITRSPAGSRWQDPLERSDYAEMVADRIGRWADAPGDGIESEGRLVDKDKATVGRFRQRMILPQGSAIVWMDIELELTSPLSGSLLENYAACRFAWNENDPVDLSRSIHTVAVPSERTTLHAEHFIELEVDDLRRTGSPQQISIFPLGLPWHVRSHAHMLDTILLPPTVSSGRFQLAIGAGRERPWEDAIRLMAAAETADGEAALGGILSAAVVASPISVDGAVRITGGEPVREQDRMTGLRCGLLESAGRRQQARLRLSRRPLAAWRTNAEGRRGAELMLEDGQVLVPLAAHEWAFIELAFVSPAGGTA